MATSDSEAYAMVFLVRSDLRMTKGKIAAQCAHGAIGAYDIARDEAPRLVEAWNADGHAKITLKVPSLDAQKSVADRAAREGIVVYRVIDEGRTQVEPGTQTVVALGPTKRTILGPITRELKLL